MKEEEEEKKKGKRCRAPESEKSSKKVNDDRLSNNISYLFCV